MVAPKKLGPIFYFSKAGMKIKFDQKIAAVAANSQVCSCEKYHVQIITTKQFPHNAVYKNHWCTRIAALNLKTKFLMLISPQYN